MSLHAFVAMPFGVKEGRDFNAVYRRLIKPALESEGFEVFRADEEMRAGSIRADMFQELLLADLVVVDLSIDNPNVWYELGVRHALRSRGVILIHSKRDDRPFDVYTDRTLRYSVAKVTEDEAAVPAPEKLEEDRKRLGRMARETVESWRGRTISPVYYHLRDLPEPDWRKLRSDQAREFWERHQEWERRIEVARRQNRAGDIVLLADEVPARIFRFEALVAAGKALRSVGSFSFALRQYESALELVPDDLESRRQKGILLGRLGRHQEARECLNHVREDHADDAETRALLGRVEKDAWVATWREGIDLAQRRQIAEQESGLLGESIRAYGEAFHLDPGHYYSGINAVTLSCLYADITGRDTPMKDYADAQGGMRWALRSALAKNERDYWARATMAELEVLYSDEETVEQAYGRAVAVAESEWFALDSSRQQLLILRDLGFRPGHVTAGLDVLERALSRLKAPWEPRHVFLFSGHMIDHPDRTKPPKPRAPRFPPEQEGTARRAIEGKLDELTAGDGDVGLCGGACGGDIIFAEACLARGLKVEIRIPFDEPHFLRESVRFAGEEWQRRFHDIKEHEHATLTVMPDRLGPSPKGMNDHARNNLWQLYSALSYGVEKVRFICLWNKQPGDGIGGTEHMKGVVEDLVGRSYPLYTTDLW